MQYVAKSGGSEEPVDSLAELDSWLERLTSGAIGEFWLVQRKGTMQGIERWVYRLLGLATDVTGSAVHILSDQGKAAIVFLDQDYNEYRVRNHEAATEGTVLFNTDEGDAEGVAAGECVPIGQAVEAVRYFFKRGRRPSWLQYRKVS